MIIIRETETLETMRELAARMFGDMVKGVVDVDREIIAVDAELHADLEALLLEDGSHQDSLWGVNFYPELPEEDFVEYDSLINIRPARGNRSRNVEHADIRQRIQKLIARRIVR